MESVSGRISTKRAFVGLDLGASAIRGVQGTHDGASFTITRSAEVMLPIGTVINGRIIDRAQVTAALKKLWRQGKFSTRNVKFAISDLNLGFEDSFFTASEALIDARLLPLGSEPLSRALICADQLHGHHDLPTLIVDIGSDDLTLVAYLQDDELFSSTQPTLGTDLAVLALTNGLGLERREATQVLFDQGVARSTASSTAVLIKSWESTLLDAIHDGIQQLSARHLDVSRVLITGIGSTIPQLKQAISDRIQHPVQFLDSQPTLSAAVGLAAMSETFHDLLPAPVHEAVALLRIKKWIVVAFVVLGMSSLAFWFYQQQQLNDLWQHVDLLRGGAK